MEFEDVQKFIHEIRKRPALWDSNSEDYKNRSMKKDAWLEIYKTSFPSYLEKNEDEKKRIAKDVHMKWKNLRDAYIRHIRHAIAMKTGKKSVRMKPYVYAKQMDFLKEVINNYRTTTNSSRSACPTDDISNDNESMQEITNTDTNETNDTPSTSLSYKKSKRRLGDKSINYTDFRQKKQQQQLQSRHHELQEENDDMAFFRSLLPTLQMLRLEEKLTFRIEVMKLLTTYTNSQRRN